MEGKIEINALTSKMPREFPARIMLSGSAWLVYQQFEYLSAKADAHSTSLLNPANSSKTDKSPQMRRAGGSTPCPSQPLPAHSSCKEVTSGDIPSRSHPAKQSICATLLPEPCWSPALREFKHKTTRQAGMGRL